MKKKSNSPKKSLSSKKKPQALKKNLDPEPLSCIYIFQSFSEDMQFFCAKIYMSEGCFQGHIYRFLCQKGSISTKKCNKIYMRKPVPESKFFFFGTQTPEFFVFFLELRLRNFFRGLSSNFFGIQTQDFFGIYFFCGTQTPYFFESKVFFF